MDITDVGGFNLLMIIINTIIAMVIALVAGKSHELIHALRAKQLGYTVKKITLWKNETDIDITEDDPNYKKISRAPYYVMFPLGTCLIVCGYYLWTIRIPYYLGVLIAGVAIIFLHVLSIKFETTEPKKVAVDKNG